MATFMRTIVLAMALAVPASALETFRQAISRSDGKALKDCLVEQGSDIGCLCYSAGQLQCNYYEDLPSPDDYMGWSVE